MTLSISNFKNIFFVIMSIVSFETILFFTTKDENAQRHPPNFFEYAFKKNENRSKFIISEKIFFANQGNYNVFQVGGSSGLHAIDPRIINNGNYSLRMFNGSCCRATGYDGYKHIAEILLQRSDKTEILILSISPLSIPTPGGNKIKTQLSRQIKINYISWTKFLNSLPSMRFRKKLTDYLYYFSFQDNIPLDKTMTLKGWSSKELTEKISKNDGWLPYLIPREGALAFPGPKEDNYFSHSEMFFKQLLELNKIASKYNSNLWVVFNPWPYEVTEGTKNFQRKLDQFSRDNQDIYFPFQFITTWDKKYFGDETHLNPEGASRASLRLRNEIKKKSKNFNF